MEKWKQTNERAIRSVEVVAQVAVRSDEVVAQVAARTRYRPKRTWMRQ